MEQHNYILLFKKFLHKQATIEEVELLHHWLKEGNAFAAWLDEQWDKTSIQLDPFVQQKILDQIKLKTYAEVPKSVTLKPQQQVRSIYKWITQVAAILILLLLTGSGVFFYMKKEIVSSDMVVMVEKGQKAHLTLPDGSKVWMNSDSRLSYGSRFNRKERVLSLDGEAYFEVAPDKKRPFIVQANGISVKALGTSFNVKSYENDDYTLAILTTGLIEVKSKLKSITLNPKELVMYCRSTGKISKSTALRVSDYSIWKENKLYFQSETFESIALSLERCYNVKIVFESDALRKCKFTGILGNSSLESILQILSLTSPLSYEVKKDRIILRENTSEKEWYEKALKKQKRRWCMN